MDIAEMTDEKIKSAKSLTTIIYALYASSLLLGITFIVAIVVNYVKEGLQNLPPVELANGVK